MTTTLAEKAANRPGGEAGLSVVRTLVLERCLQDGWSADARSCVVSATSDQARNDCLRRYLTVEQDAKVRADLDAKSADLGRHRIARTLRKLTQFADRACACKDKACADAVEADLSAWSAAEAKKGANDSLNETEKAEATATSERFARCLLAAASGSAAPAPAAP